MLPAVCAVLCLAVLGVAGEEEECAGRVGFFPHHEQCDKYYQCKDDTLSSHLCPDGLVYDSSHFKASFQLDSSGSSGKCSYPFSIDCTGRELLQPASPSEECPRKNGYFPHSACDKYYFCNDGAANLYSCPGGLVFAPDKGRCTWIEEANRPGCQSKDKFEFSCPEVGPSEHPRYPDPADCQKFYVCISGSAHHNSCPEGLVFHPLTLACDRQEAVDGPCSSWYNKTTVDALNLPDALPTPATARPISRKPEAFLNRRRPSSPSINEENDEMKTNVIANFEEVSTGKNIRVRTRMKGSVLRPRSKQSSEKSPQAVDGSQRITNREENNMIHEDQQRETSHQQDPLQEAKASPVPRVRTRTRSRSRTRTRTRISSASLPNTVKGEEATSRQRTRVRGRVNIRQT